MAEGAHKLSLGLYYQYRQDWIGMGEGAGIFCHLFTIFWTHVSPLFAIQFEPYHFLWRQTRQLKHLARLDYDGTVNRSVVCNSAQSQKVQLNGGVGVGVGVRGRGLGGSLAHNPSSA